ncbi:DUF2093 domain-containing protein [Aureimonas pseudogalii]|jgi:hypothetical protein|uniref:DUF2093 domain-containing protein n=1 Tax=Aureimonas pseudogalii TaxID=1744844 RepID=A0A7W6E8F4_9HYPH|nr:DUF2093 domain-containing protein [Aureimonas pseudogalii]MBB3996623.1 hypothetical protein [Aureimonas pseudogalii]
MMNRMDSGGEAKLRYLDADFEVVRPGAFVRCAVTGEAIPLDLLKYWSVERQEPYADAAASLARELELDPGLRKRSTR